VRRRRSRWTVTPDALAALAETLLADARGLFGQGGAEQLAAANEIADEVDAIKAALAARTDAKLAASGAKGSARLPSTSDMAAASPGPVVTGGAARIERMADRTITDFDGLIGDVQEALQHLEGIGGDYPTERLAVGRIKLDFPDERFLRAGDDASANAKVTALVADAWRPENWTPGGLAARGVSNPEALVASGGFCAPAMPDYGVPQISGMQRPVKDGLGGVGMDRGQVTIVQPPRLVDVATSATQTAGSAVSVWTNAIDTTPGGTTKPFQTMACPNPVTVALQAIVEQIKIGNFNARAFPEQVAAVMANTASAWARRAESQLLAQIDTNSTAVTVPQVLGGTADYFAALSRLASAVRNRNRMDPNAKLRCLVPRWFVDFVAADIAKTHAGDGLERFTVGEADVRAMFASRNVNVTFYEDQSDRGAAVAQIFGAQGATALRHWPPGGGVATAQVVWFLFPEGTHTVGDGGTLELGIVRDSTLNLTNDYAFFTESFEAIIPKVIESWKVTSNLCDTGAGAIDITDACAGTS
jgi:hypothetical protein